jgi:hypothetical protein
VLRTLLPGTNLKGVKIEKSGEKRRLRAKTTLAFGAVEPGPGAGKGRCGVVVWGRPSVRRNLGLIEGDAKKGETPGFEPSASRCSMS